MKNGNFYFIDDLKKVSDWFILSLSGLQTVLAEHIQIFFEQVNPQYFIKKFYGKDID